MKKIANILIILSLLFTVFIPTVNAEEQGYNIDFELHSQAALVINLDTDTVVFSQNADERLEPASLTKIMVSLLVLENIEDLDETQITVQKKSIDALAGTNSSLSGVKVGEILSARQLLYCLMIPSGNDAAMVFADYLGNGNVSTFVEMMNKRAQELGMTNTQFANPHGLHNASHFTSANDLAILMKYILSSKYADTFMTICKTTRYTIPASDVRPKAVTLATTNLMMDSVSGGKYYYKYTEGVKTGSTSDAGYCLVTTAYNPTVDYRYLCICLEAPLRDSEGVKLDNGAMLDSKALYEWAFNTFSYKTLVTAGTPAVEVKLEYAWEKDSVLLVPEADFGALVPSSIDQSSIVLKPDENLPEFLTAPIEKGQVVCEAEVTYAGIVLGKVNLIVSETVEASQLLLLRDQAERFLQSKWLKIGIVAVVFLVVVYIVVIILHNRKKRKRRNYSSRNNYRGNRYR